MGRQKNLTLAQLFCHFATQPFSEIVVTFPVSHHQHPSTISHLFEEDRHHAGFDSVIFLANVTGSKRFKNPGDSLLASKFETKLRFPKVIRKWRSQFTPSPWDPSREVFFFRPKKVPPPDSPRGGKWYLHHLHEVLVVPPLRWFFWYGRLNLRRCCYESIMIPVAQVAGARTPQMVYWSLQRV